MNWIENRKPSIRFENLQFFTYICISLTLTTLPNVPSPSVAMILSVIKRTESKYIRISLICECGQNVYTEKKPLVIFGSICNNDFALNFIDAKKKMFVMQLRYPYSGNANKLSKLKCNLANSNTELHVQFKIDCEHYIYQRDNHSVFVEVFYFNDEKRYSVIAFGAVSACVKLNE